MIEIPKKENAVSSIFNTMATPFQKFARLESASGLLLIFVTLIAMGWANSPWSDSYLHFTETPIGFAFGSFILQKTLHHWVNDGLMVIFFFVVGMEIKRELLEGELSSPRKAALPIFAALGGMVCPALFYLAFNSGPETSHGWAIPMATDIAFAVGVLVLLGRRAPMALMVFLLALAIVDDLGAVVVIASFYTEELHPAALGWALIGFAMIWILRFAGVRARSIYLVLSIAVWFAVLKSGVHATVSGVVLGFLTPLGALIPRNLLHSAVPKLLDDLNEEKLQRLQYLVEETQSPLEKSVEILHPWVNFLIMPIFALVNAGVVLKGVDLQSVFSHQVTLGVLAGLVLGKPIGIVVTCWLATKAGVAELPRGVTWLQILGVGCLAGIGFTMALFVSHLSFKLPGFETYSKVGILSASLLSAILGSIILLIVGSRLKQQAR